MALNTQIAEKQVQQLTRQSASAAHTTQSLVHYRNQLSAAWSGEECRYIEFAINDLIRKCRELSEKTESLERDMACAIEDILAEEAEDGTT